MSSQTDLNAAREIHIKFEFYFVALTFTMVAFAIQTGEFHGRATDFLEGISWVALVLSGLMGLSRLECSKNLVRPRCGVLNYFANLVQYCRALLKPNRE